VGADVDSVDGWNLRLAETPATVVSSTIEGRPDRSTATVASGDGVDTNIRAKRNPPCH